MAEKPLRRVGELLDRQIQENYLKKKPWLKYPQATNEFALENQKQQEELAKLRDIVDKYRRRFEKEGLL